MIRRCLPALWMMLVCPLVAEELPPGILAMLGKEPYGEYAASGVPLPPTPEQVAALPKKQLRADRVAMKRVLLAGMARTRAARWREKTENLARMAQDAEAFGCPAAFVQILRMRANPDISRRVSYTLRQAQEHMQQVYGVDELQMRLVLDAADADVDVTEQLLCMLPLHAVFNMAYRKEQSLPAVVADLRCYAEVQQQAADALAQVADDASAQAAIPSLLQLLPVYDTTLTTRFLLMQGLIKGEGVELDAVSEALGKSGKLLREQRMRLMEQNWYGCSVLKAIDALLN